MILTIAAITLYLVYGYVLATLRYNAKGIRSFWMIPFWLPFVAWMIIVAIFDPMKEF
jgi:hypothetical protein